MQYICKCNNCWLFMQDTNPWKDSIRFTECFTENFKELKNNKCLDCDTDEYLIDITEIMQITEL